MTLVFFLLLLISLAALSAVFMKKTPFISAVCVELLFFLAVVALGNMVTVLRDHTVYDRILLPFVTMDGKAYFWQLYFDRASGVLAAFVLTVAFVLSVFSLNFFEKKDETRFLCLISLASAALLLCLGARNVFQFLIGWDVTVLSSYLLLILFYNRRDICRAGVRFWMYHKATDLPLFIVFFMMKNAVGGYEFAAPAAMTTTQTMIFFFLLLTAVLVKSACLGMTELSKTPLPALAFTAPVAFGTLSVYLMYRLMPTDGIYAPLLLGTGTAVATGGVVSALRQTNVKAFLASVLASVFGFVFLSFALFDKMSALRMALAYVLPVSFLMMAAGGAVFACNGETDMRRMGMLKRAEPLLSVCLWLFCMALVGFPYVGTYAVWRAITARVLASEGMVPAVLFVVWTVVSFLTAVAAGKMLYAFQTGKGAIVETLRPLSPVMVLTVTGAVVLALFQNMFFFQFEAKETVWATVYAVSSALLSCAGIPVGWRYMKKRGATDAPADVVPMRREREKMPFAEALFVRLTDKVEAFVGRLKMPVFMVVLTNTVKEMHLTYFYYALVWLIASVSLFLMATPLFFMEG